MNFLHKYIDSNVYKTNAIVQKDNNNVQNKDSNVHVRLLRKARKAVNESMEAEAKIMEELLTVAMDLIEIVLKLFLPDGSIKIISESHRRSLSISVKAPEVWDVCINAYGKRVCAL